MLGIVIQLGFVNCSRNYGISGNPLEGPIIGSLSFPPDPHNNAGPTAKDFYLEPEKDVKTVVTLQDFSAFDLEGDPLTLSLLDDKNDEVDRIEDPWTIVNIAPGDRTRLEIQSHLLGAATYKVRISDPTKNRDVQLTISPKNPFLKFKPALALNKSQCLFCHSQVNGNYVTSMGTDDSKMEVTFQNGGDPVDPERRFGDFFWTNYTDYYAKSFWMTTHLKGTVYLPHRSLSKAGAISASSLITEAQLKQILVDGQPAIPLLDFSAVKGALLDLLKNPQTGGQYIYSLSSFRSKAFLDRLLDWTGIKKTLVPDTMVQEVDSVKISAPSEAEILAKVKKGTDFTYYPQGPTSSPLLNFGKRPLRKSLEGKSPARLFGNVPDQVMACDGDLFVKGPVLLQNLKLKTKLGCRIHASGVVWMSGSFTDSVDPAKKNGYVLVDPTESSALELVSARALLLGLGYINVHLGGHAIYAYPTARLQHAGNPLPPGTLEDVKLIVGDSADDSLILDAGTDPAKPEAVYGNRTSVLRKVNLSRLLLNAPVIHSRYTGDFKGVVIGDFALWSLGQFKYEYDPIFEKIPILPMIDSRHFFDVKLCEVKKMKAQSPSFTECIP